RQSKWTGPIRFASSQGRRASEARSRARPLQHGSKGEGWRSRAPPSRCKIGNCPGSAIHLPWQRFISRLLPDSDREDAEQSKAGHHPRGGAEVAAEGRNQEPGHQRAEARNDAPRAIAERDRGGAHMRRKKLRQVNGMTRENAPYEVAEGKEDVRVGGIAVDYKVEVEPDCQCAGIVAG